VGKGNLSNINVIVVVVVVGYLLRHTYSSVGWLGKERPRGISVLEWASRGCFNR
jgi:hypothetical protein